MDVMEYMDEEKLRKCKIEVKENINTFIVPKKVKTFTINLDEETVTFYGDW